MTIKLYSEASLDSFLNSKRNYIVSEINGYDDNYILDVGEAQIIDYLTANTFLEFPTISKENAYLTETKRDINARDFPPEFIMSHYGSGRSIEKAVIVYNLPYSGMIDLLRYRPNTYSPLVGMDMHIDTTDHVVVIEIVNFYDDVERIRRSYEDQLRYIFCCYDNLKSEVDSFNGQLEKFIKVTISNRKQGILKTHNLISSLGVPIRQSSSAPQTFSIPSPKLREKIIVRPTVSSTGYVPEPTLDESSYNRILELINDVGITFERLTATYSDKCEEDLRDHILLFLDPYFEKGSASGETFNKSGKTDILIHYEGSIVFIAECKFWRGEKIHLQTLDQLLSYLTWRDSKTAVIIFIKNKEITKVLKTVRRATGEHPNFIKELPQTSNSWFNYVFSLPGDSNKELKIAILMFHIP